VESHVSQRRETWGTHGAEARFLFGGFTRRLSAALPRCCIPRFFHPGACGGSSAVPSTGSDSRCRTLISIFPGNWWAACATVEERPFQGRVRSHKHRGLQPQWSSFRVIPDLEGTSSACDRCHTRFYPRASTIGSMDSQRTFFITTVTWRRSPIFRVEGRARLLIELLFGYRDQGKYLLHEFVVMPDHIHLLLTPAPEISLERAVQFIKGGYSYRLRRVEKIQVWQESFTNHRIRDFDDYQRHCEYVRMNPVRARLVRDAGAYPFSSACPGFRLDAIPQGLKPGFSKSA
jgi:putative transposase